MRSTIEHNQPKLKRDAKIDRNPLKLDQYLFDVGLQIKLVTFE